MFILKNMHIENEFEIQLDTDILLNLDNFKSIKIHYNYRSKTWSILGIDYHNNPKTIETYQTYDQVINACNELYRKLKDAGQVVSVKKGCPEYSYIVYNDAEIPFS